MNLVYDCEIARCIPSKGFDRVGIFKSEKDFFGSSGGNLEYCGGWDDFENMGISVIGVADLDSDQVWSFVSPDLGEFQSLIYACQGIGGKIYGFNSRRFDDNLCRANSIAISTDFDLLEEVCIAAYGSPRWEDTPPGFSYSLAKLAEANGLQKNGSGDLAPILWQQGRRQEVVDYCLNDAKITRDLIRLFLANQLVDPNTKKLLPEF